MTEGEELSWGGGGTTHKNALRKSLDSLKCQTTCEHKITALASSVKLKFASPPALEGGWGSH